MISIILGTRPEIIKMAPVIRACEQEGLDFQIIHSGQHYSYDMDKIFFEELKLPKPDYTLECSDITLHGAQTGAMLPKIEEVLIKEKPEIVLVEGDTNTVLAGALAASKLTIPIGHVEAGLRSFDRHMPEEINRILTDHCSDLLFAPTEIAKRNLTTEGIPSEKIHLTGNTIVDAVQQNLKLAEEQSEERTDDYFLMTVHRQENVDSKESLSRLITELEELVTEYEYPIVFPIHPRTQKRLEEFNLFKHFKKIKGVELIKPQGYLNFLVLMKNARLVLTDSGGLQEEACCLQVPCVTLRENTERPETITVGANRLAWEGSHYTEHKQGQCFQKLKKF